MDVNTFFYVSILDHLLVLFPDVVMVLASEVAVDVVKHAFITKFNDISADVSLSFQTLLCCNTLQDLLGIPDTDQLRNALLENVQSIDHRQ